MADITILGPDCDDERASENVEGLADMTAVTEIPAQRARQAPATDLLDQRVQQASLG